MYRVTLNKKATFNYVGKVVIQNLDGTPFYSHEVNGWFNLPKGQYLSNVNLLSVKSPLFKFVQIEKPKRERNEREKNFTLRFWANPNKATIHRPSGKVYIDNNFWRGLTPLERKFVLLHEKGHYQYKTELSCDIYAANVLLREGFNMSQVARCSNNNLKDKKHRVLPLINHFKNVKRK